MQQIRVRSCAAAAMVDAMAKDAPILDLLMELLPTLPVRFG